MLDVNYPVLILTESTQYSLNLTSSAAMFPSDGGEEGGGSVVF